MENQDHPLIEQMNACGIPDVTGTITGIYKGLSFVIHHPTLLLEE